MKPGDIVRFGQSAASSVRVLLLEINAEDHSGRILCNGATRWVPLTWLIP